MEEEEEEEVTDALVELEDVCDEEAVDVDVVGAAVLVVVGATVLDVVAVLRLNLRSSIQKGVGVVLLTTDMTKLDMVTLAFIAEMGNVTRVHVLAAIVGRTAVNKAPCCCAKPTISGGTTVVVVNSRKLKD